MPNVGPLEIMIVLVIALVVFGPKRLPELGKSLGKGIREFRGTVTGEHAEVEKPPVLERSPAGTRRDVVETDAAAKSRV